MPEISDDTAREPDWVFDPSKPPPPRATDSRLPLAAGVLRATQSQLEAVIVTTGMIEGVIRDAASTGVTPDDLASELSLPIETVERVLAGGSIFDWLR